jgi:hypothetical protein
MQPQHVGRRSAIAARVLALATPGHELPRFRGLGLGRLAVDGGARSFMANLVGTRSRVVAGQAREPVRGSSARTRAPDVSGPAPPR